MKSLETLSDGYYVPSPGMIYPSLTYLEEVGHAEAELVGTKKSYQLTDAGREYLQTNRGVATGILADFAQIGTRMDAARRAFSGDTESGENLEGQSDALRTVRHELKLFLRSFSPNNQSEDARVAEIIGRTVAELRGQKPTFPPEALMEIIQNRRSMGLSRMSDAPVDRTFVEQVLEAANWAPSHDETEPWRFSAFMGEGRAVLADLFASAKGEEARKRAFAAPVWISIGMTPKLNEDGSLAQSEEEEVMAVACAVQNLHLMAHSLGLIGMWHSKGLSTDPVVADGLDLKAPSRLLGFFMLGWPSGERLTGSRGPIAEKVRWFETGSEAS